jgi:murein DD-endopeptidase MepM/ murein hydrolase activator NlpD
MLGKVVVVSHSGKMHTVYAGLSKIAPNIKKGSKIKKGYVIGKVSRKLIFEATKNSKHINPLKLIRI